MATTATKSPRAGSYLAVFPLNEFTAAFNSVAKAVPSRTPSPVLLCIHLDLLPGEAFFTSTNLEIWIRSHADCDYCGEPTSVLLTRSMMSDIIRSAEGDIVELRIGETSLNITVGKSSWKMPTSDASIFPRAPGLKLESYHEVEASRLALAIRRVVKETRPGVTEGSTSSTIQVEPLLTGISLTTFNGRSLAHQQIEAACCQPLVVPDTLPLLPDAAARTLQSLLTDPREMVKVGFPDANHGIFQVGSTTLRCRLSEGRFQEWRKHIGRFPKPVGVMSANCGSLKRAIAQACVSLDDEKRSLEFVLTPNGFFQEYEKGLLQLFAESNRGKSESKLEVDWTGPDSEWPMTVDPQYIRNMLGTLGDETPVQLIVHPDPYPMKLVTEDGFFGLVQPIGK